MGPTAVLWEYRCFMYSQSYLNTVMAQYVTTKSPAAYREALETVLHKPYLSFTNITSFLEELHVADAQRSYIVVCDRGGQIIWGSVASSIHEQGKIEALKQLQECLDRTLEQKTNGSTNE